MTLPLQHDGGHKSLDLGSLELGLLAFLDGQGTLDHVLAHVVILAEVEQLADLGGSLGSQSTGNGVVSEAGDFVLALLHNHDGEDRQIAVNNATTDRLALALAGSSLAEARMPLGEKKANTSLGQHTLLHRESLLVVASGDAEDIAFPLVAEGGRVNLRSHALFIEGPNL